MSNAAKKHGISLEAVAYYLDGVERDRLDTTGPGGKAGEAIAIRDQLLRLPEEAFKAAIRSMKAVVADAAQSQPGSTTDKDGEAKGAMRKLYDEARSGRSASGRGNLGKVTGS